MRMCVWLYMHTAAGINIIRNESTWFSVWWAVQQSGKNSKVLSRACILQYVSKWNRKRWTNLQTMSQPRCWQPQFQCVFLPWSPGIHCQTGQDINCRLSILSTEVPNRVVQDVIDLRSTVDHVDQRQSVISCGRHWPMGLVPWLTETQTMTQWPTPWA